jgi:hypothetical protein
LNVSQVELENGYYMVDLPTLIEKKRKSIVEQRLGDIFMILATNNRGIEEAEYKTYINNLNKSLGIKIEEKFDRNKFEELRMMTNMGGNRVK